MSGYDPKPELIYNGRRCVVSHTVRLQHGVRSRGYYNSVSVSYLSDDLRVVGSESVTAARFNRAAKPTGRRVISAGTGVYVEVSP